MREENWERKGIGKRSKIFFLRKPSRGERNITNSEGADEKKGGKEANLGKNTKKTNTE